MTYRVAIRISDNIFDRHRKDDMCWFTVRLDNQDFDDYLSTKRYPEFVLDPLVLELSEK